MVFHFKHFTNLSSVGVFRCFSLLSDEDVENMGVRLMPGYKDPFHKRPMKKGEIGCFLSHYFLWDEVRSKGYELAAILEDDVRFEPFFNQKMRSLLQEVRNLSFEWDLIYLGRKKLEEKNEEAVEGTNHLVWAGYSYWTLGYLLSARGAAKLIAANPMKNLLPVDEYLPILYDKHPSDEWKSFYPRRDLVALSVEPLILYPTRYLHEEGYVSDTEDSAVVSSTPNPEL
ncbi:Glycosyltransferase family 25 (LPS biosynthesis protein) [Nesidiocoris tenuis]|uniref:Glycosyltransferase family 25 (LPS biosynthesis protein) n=1 Tax=Nesidiocoris tenuis TaxID=355587 RepID=A0ABN7B197_9HEMI|nr:Glycosyltransferase family 25 (LPS biosynthesis protein) [Nesidiocoris tenuis]